jgi:anti-sigma B factor antagonist
MSGDGRPEADELLEVERADAGGEAVLLVRGEIDLASAPVLGAAVVDALAERPAVVVVDLAGVRFMDSTGLRALLDARLGAGAAGVALRLRAPSPAVARVLELTGVVAMFDVER